MNHILIIPIFHLLKVIRHGKDVNFVGENQSFADDQNDVVKQLMLEGTIKTAQDDVGHPFRIRSSNIAIVNLWTRASNDIMVSSVEEMTTIHPTTSQLLRAGVNCDKRVGPPRMCLSLLIAGLKASAFMIENIAPLIIDLIPGINRIKGTTCGDDFDERNGSVEVRQVMPLAMPRMKYILQHYSKILSEGKDVWDAWMECIRQEGHIVMTLDDAQISLLDPEYKKWRSILGGDDVFRSILIKHRETGKIIALFNSIQIASNIGGVSPDEFVCIRTRTYLSYELTIFL